MTTETTVKMLDEAYRIIGRLETYAIHDTTYDGRAVAAWCASYATHRAAIGASVTGAAHPTAGEWFCEEHPEKLMGHDGCRGAGIPDQGRLEFACQKLRMERQKNNELLEQVELFGLTAAIGAGGQAVAVKALEAAWIDFCDANPDDLTSPEDLPDHALMTCAQFVEYALSTLSHPHPADERVVEALRAAYEKVKLWPENRMMAND